MSAKRATPRRDLRSAAYKPVMNDYSFMITCQLFFLRSRKGMSGALTLKGRKVVRPKGHNRLAEAAMPYSR